MQLFKAIASFFKACVEKVKSLFGKKEQQPVHSRNDAVQRQLEFGERKSQIEGNMENVRGSNPYAHQAFKTTQWMLDLQKQQYDKAAKDASRPTQVTEVQPSSVPSDNSATYASPPFGSL